jgi:phage terminase small subunit
MKTADGRRLRRLPADADAIARRLARDIPGLTDADMALVEDTARWVAVAAGAYSQLIEGKPQPTAEQLERQEVETLLLTVTDTAHGNKEESRKNPLLIVMRTASEQIRANAQQLGASPLSRARMPEPEREQLSLADVLFGDAVAHAPAPAANDE